MKPRKIIVGVMAVVLLSGCAYRPIVDMKGKTKSEYNSDLEY